MTFFQKDFCYIIKVTHGFKNNPERTQGNTMNTFSFSQATQAHTPEVTMVDCLVFL